MTRGRMNQSLFWLKNHDRPCMRKAEIYGAVTLGGLIFLLIVIRILTA